MKKILTTVLMAGLMAGAGAAENAGSMGGAPNVGAGMGTGTGAGSTVGPETGKGAASSGAMGAPEAEMYESVPEDIEKEETRPRDRKLEREFRTGPYEPIEDPEFQEDKNPFRQGPYGEKAEQRHEEEGPEGPKAEEAVKSGRLEDDPKEQKRKQQGE